MKNKSLTYILLIVVAIIWYNVFFRVKDNLFGESEVMLNQREQLISNIQIISKDTFELNASYADPFGAVNRIEKIESKPIQQNNYSPANRSIKWPNIKYYGIVRKSSSSNPMGIIKIDGQQFTLRSGESPYDGLYIKRVWRDSVWVKYQSHHKIYYR